MSWVTNRIVFFSFCQIAVRSARIFSRVINKVQGAERFIHKDQGRVRRQCPGNLNALARRLQETPLSVPANLEADGLKQPHAPERIGEHPEDV